MRYEMKQKWFSWGDDFVIRDENGREAYIVDGAGFSIGDRLTVRDAVGQEVARIHQKLLALGPTYEITVGGRVLAVVKKHLFSLFRAKFSVDVEGPDDLEARGHFLDHEYSFYRGDQVVAQVSRRWFSITDTYGVEVADGEDPVLILCGTAIIDLISHDGDKR